MADTLAEAFVNSGLIVRENILDALGVQRSRGGALDTALLEAELATERDILDVLEQHYELESANRTQVERIDMGIVETFPRHYAETYRMAPLRVSGNSIRLLVSTPPHPRVLERIEKRIKLHPIAVITVEARLHDAMRRLYGKEPPPRFATLLDDLAQRPDTPPKTTLDITQNIVVEEENENQPEQDLSDELSSLEAFKEASTAAGTVSVLIEQVLGACSGLFDTVVYLKNEGSHLAGQGGRKGGEEIAYPLLIDDWGALKEALISDEVLELSLVHTHTEHVLNLPTSTPGLAAAVNAHEAPQGLLIGFGPNSSTANETLGALAQATCARLEELIPSEPVVLLQEEPEEKTAEQAEEETTEEPEEETAEQAEEETAEEPEEETAEQAEEETAEEPEEQAEEETAEEPEEETAEQAEEETAEQPEKEIAEQPEEEALSPELESWKDVVQATQAVNDSGAQEDVANFNEEPHQDAEHIEPDPETPTPTGSFEIENPDEQGPTGWDQTPEPEPEPAPPANIQEPTLVMAPPLVEKLIEESTQPDANPPETMSPEAQQATRETLVTTLESEDPAEREQAIAQLLALEEQADLVIRNRFPGPIAFDPFAAGTLTPALKDCNGLMAYLDRRGSQSIDIVSSHLQSSNPRARFFALYMMHHHAGAEHLDLISRRLYDTQPAIRIMAAETLRRHKASAQYTQVLQGLMRQLKVPVLETRVSVVQIFGQLRERRAVPVLISLLGSGGRELVSTAVSALAVICGQEFGVDTEAWQAWWSEHQSNGRGQWLCQGLLHKNPAIQNVCNRELELSSGLSMGYQNQMGSGDKKKVAARWSSWLQEQREVDFSI